MSDENQVEEVVEEAVEEATVSDAIEESRPEEPEAAEVSSREEIRKNMAINMREKAARLKG